MARCRCRQAPQAKIRFHPLLRLQLQSWPEIRLSSATFLPRDNLLPRSLPVAVSSGQLRLLHEFWAALQTSELLARQTLLFWLLVPDVCRHSFVNSPIVFYPDLITAVSCDHVRSADLFTPITAMSRDV